jgi:hypothetical protein
MVIEGRRERYRAQRGHAPAEWQPDFDIVVGPEMAGGSGPRMGWPFGFAPIG